MHKTKEKIITTALNLFFTKGYKETSLTNIITETNLSKGALYHHFSSKDAIANEALSYLFQSLHERALAIESSDKSALEKFFEISQAKCVLMKGHEFALFELLYHLRHSDIRSKLIIQNRANFSPLLVSIIKQGIQEGTFKPTLNPENAVHCIFSLHEGGDFISEEDFKDKAKMETYTKDIDKAICFLLGMDTICCEK